MLPGHFLKSFIFFICIFCLIRTLLLSRGYFSEKQEYSLFLRDAFRTLSIIHGRGGPLDCFILKS